MTQHVEHEAGRAPADPGPRRLTPGRVLGEVALSLFIGAMVGVVVALVWGGLSLLAEARADVPPDESAAGWIFLLMPIYLGLWGAAVVGLPLLAWRLLRFRRPRRPRQA